MTDEQIEQRREYKRQYYLKNKAHIVAKVIENEKNRKAQDPETFYQKARKKGQRWYVKHSERISKSRSEKRAQKLEQAREQERNYQKERRRANPEKVRARARELYKPETVKRYYDKHREQILEKERQDRTANLEQMRAYQREWKRKQFQANPEKVRAAEREKFHKNPEAFKAKYHRRRSLKSDSIADLTKEQVNEILSAGCLFADHTCRGPLSIAHDIAVSKKGNTTRANTFCLCQSHNSRMGTNSLQDLLEQKRLF